MEGQEARGPEIPVSTPQELSHNAGVAENSLGTSDSGAGEGLPVTDEELAATLSVLRRLAKVPDLHKKARYMNVRIACGKLVKDQQLKKTCVIALSPQMLNFISGTKYGKPIEKPKSER